MRSWKLNADELAVESFELGQGANLNVPAALEPGDGGILLDPEPAPTEGSSCITACTRYQLPCC